MTNPQRLATAAAAVLGLLMLFQLLLALGLPLGRAAWGGQYDVLPTNLRLSSLAAVAILGLAAWVMLARADLVRPGPKGRIIRWAAWGFAAYLALNTAGNLVSTSPIERAVMTPVTIFLAVSFVIVALSRSKSSSSS